MRLGRLVRRTIKWFLITALMLVAAGLATVQISQRLFRHRAELLLADVQTLTVGKSTWEDFRRIETKWGAFGHYEGSCTAKLCGYEIGFGEWPWEGGLWNSSLPEMLYAPFALAMEALHDHMATMSADIQVADGTVSALRVQLMTDVPKGYGPGWRFEGEAPTGYVPYTGGEYGLISGFRSSAGIVDDRWRATIFWPSPVPQPGIRVREPSGCEICISIHTDYNPTADERELRPLLQLNLDCITRWMPCTEESDVMPAAWKRYRADDALSRALDDRLSRCDFTVAERFRTAAGAVLARLVGSHFIRGGRLDLSETKRTYRVERLLKPNALLVAGDLFVLRRPYNNQLPLPGINTVGDRRVMLFPMDGIDRTGGETALDTYESCAVLPASPEVLAEIAR